MRLGNKDIREKSVPPSLGICPFDIFHIIEHRCRIRHPMIVYYVLLMSDTSPSCSEISVLTSIAGEIIPIVLANRS